MTTLDYVVRFWEISAMENLSTSAVAVFNQILRVMNRQRSHKSKDLTIQITWSSTLLQKDTGCSDKTIKRALDELQAAQILTYSTQKGRKIGYTNIALNNEKFAKQPIENPEIPSQKHGEIPIKSPEKHGNFPNEGEIKHGNFPYLEELVKTAVESSQATILGKITDLIENKYGKIPSIKQENTEINTEINTEKFRNLKEYRDKSNTISVEVSTETFDAPAESQNVEPQKQPKPKTKKQPETDPAKIQANVKQSIVLYLFSEYVKADGVPPPRFGAAEAKAAKDFAQKLSDLIDLKLKNGEVQTPNEIGSFYVDLRGRKVNFDTNPNAKQNDATRATESPVLRLFAMYCAAFFSKANELPDKFLSQTRDLKIFNSKFNDFYVKFTNPHPATHPINGADANESFEQSVERYTNAIT